jgi:RNA polymerase sigma factor (sigma-70 family)
MDDVDIIKALSNFMGAYIPDPPHEGKRKISQNRLLLNLDRNRNRNLFLVMKGMTIKNEASNFLSDFAPHGCLIDEMQAKSDTQLLRDYSAQKSESGFGEIVHRHGDLVYSAALRQVESPDLAGEIAQRVFIDLSRKARSLAGSLREDASLAGWLYRATRYAALTLLREERRRHARESQVMQELHSVSESSPDWDSVSPLLDEAISKLDEQERDALLLRFFKNQDFRAVGAALGVSDDTAQKRVARCLEKLRTALLRHGVTTTTTALAAALASQAVQAAPAGLAPAWISASLASATTEGSAALTLLKLMSMTKLQLGLGAIVVSGLAATVAVQHQTANKMDGEIQALRRQVASLATDNESLSNRLQQVSAGSPLADDQLRELLRLRGEVGMLRDKTNLVGNLQKQNRKLFEQMNSLLANLAKLKNESIEPLDPSSEAAKFVQHRQDILQAARLIGNAFRIYSNEHNDHFPTNFAQIPSELGNVTNFDGDISLDSFEMVNVGKANDTYPQGAAVRERAPRQSPLGGWERVYLMCDGSAKVATSSDANFDDWEQSNYANNFSPASQ